MDKKFNIAIIGLGNRGSFMITDTIVHLDDVEIIALCDVYEDRTEKNAKVLEDLGRVRPKTFTNYHDVLALPEVDAVLCMTSWETHIEIVCASMEAGKPIGFEVGGAYCIDDLWKMIHTYEKTGTPCAMLENCLYGDNELMVLNMVRQGLFGEIVHCSGGYRHDLRNEIANGRENRHYRFRNYLNRNCENYPTHELGPIASVLNINHGNRMVSLVSMASKSAGLHEYIMREKGPDYDAANFTFAQGDIVDTIIKCAHGETIHLQLDTTLPRAYSRSFCVRGTKAKFDEDNDSLFMDGEDNKYDFEWKSQWGNAEKYREKYEHPFIAKYKADSSLGGHGGMDWLELRAFFDGLKSGRCVPVDVYDAASWMAISALSEESIAKGGAPVAIPDFTSGNWITRPVWEP